MRALAWLIPFALTACETSAPVQPVDAVRETVRQEAPPVETTGHRLDSADLRLSEACEQDGNLLCAVEALARYVRGHDAPSLHAGSTTGRPEIDAAAGLQTLNDRLWRLTAAMAPARIEALAASHELAPLWQLRQAMSGSRSQAEQVSRFSAWRARWPEHPFVGTPPASLSHLLEKHSRAGRVGLFVPLSGPIASAGRAVRDGFIAAYFDEAMADKPVLLIYDSAAKPIPALYEQCLLDDIELVVGPLSRHRLDALSSLNPRVPILGLNYLSDGQARNRPADPAGSATAPADVAGGQALLQLGLAIEDEAATITRRLLSEGLHRLLAVHGSEDWAGRGARALAAEWPYDIETQAFPDVRTITESVGQAMRVAESLERREDLQRLLRVDLEFMPRARSDLDAVVAFVNHIEAAALAPALKFHYAEGIPVFASSQSVREASTLDELDGFEVAEMPFNLSSDPLWTAVQQVFDGRRGNTAALHALGVDAWRIVNNWDWVAAGEPLYGATGKLQLAEGGRIQRTLAWSRIARGQVQAIADGAVTQRQ